MDIRSSIESIHQWRQRLEMERYATGQAPRLRFDALQSLTSDYVLVLVVLRLLLLVLDVAPSSLKLKHHAGSCLEHTNRILPPVFWSSLEKMRQDSWIGLSYI